MALPDDDSTVAHSFGIEFDGVLVTRIREVSGLKMEQDVVESKVSAPDEESAAGKLPGRFKPGEVTLTRGLTHDSTFSDWVRSNSAGPDGARRGGAIIFYDFEGAEIKRFRLQDPRPRSLEIATVKAGDTTVLTEKLVVTYEDLDVE